MCDLNKCLCDVYYFLSYFYRRVAIARTTLRLVTVYVASTVLVLLSVLVTVFVFVTGLHTQDEVGCRTVLELDEALLEDDAGNFVLVLLLVLLLLLLKGGTGMSIPEHIMLDIGASAGPSVMVMQPGSLDRGPLTGSPTGSGAEQAPCSEPVK